MPIGPDTPRCGAKTKRGPCPRAGTEAGGRCHYHGGKSTGPKTWKAGGARSKKVAAFMQQIQSRAIDPALLDIRDKLASFDKREADLLERALDEYDSPGFRAAALALFAEAESSMSDPAKLAAAMHALGEHLKRGANEDAAVENALDIAERRVRQTIELRSVMVREANAISLQQFSAFVGLLVGTVMRTAGPKLGPVIAMHLKAAWEGKETPAAWQRRLAEVTETAMAGEGAEDTMTQ